MGPLAEGKETKIFSVRINARLPAFNALDAHTKLSRYFTEVAKNFSNEEEEPDEEKISIWEPDSEISVKPEEG